MSSVHVEGCALLIGFEGRKLKGSLPGWLVLWKVETLLQSRELPSQVTVIIINRVLGDSVEAHARRLVSGIRTEHSPNLHVLVFDGVQELLKKIHTFVPLYLSPALACGLRIFLKPAEGYTYTGRVPIRFRQLGVTGPMGA